MAYVGTVAGVDLPMLRYWIEHELLEEAFDVVLPADYEGLPQIPSDLKSPTWYLAKGLPADVDVDDNNEADDDDGEDLTWEGWAVVREDQINGASYSLIMLFVERDDHLDPALGGNVGDLAAGWIRLFQRRVGEVHIQYDDILEGFFGDFLADWLADLYECEANYLPDVTFWPISWRDSDKIDITGKRTQEDKYWLRTKMAAEGSGNIDQYLESREIPRSTYYDNTKKFRVRKSGQNPDTEPDR